MKLTDEQVKAVMEWLFACPLEGTVVMTREMMARIEELAFVACVVVSPLPEWTRGLGVDDMFRIGLKLNKLRGEMDNSVDLLVVRL